MDQMFSIDNYLSESFTSDGKSNHNFINKDNNSINDETENYNFTYSINDRKIYRANSPIKIENRLDPWQNWRLRKKILEEKKKEYDKLRKAQKALEKLKMDEKEREEKKRRCEALKQKIEQRNIEKKKQIEEQERKLMQLKQEEEERKQKSKEKAEEKFSKWCDDKKAAEELKKLQLKEEQLKKELEAIIKKKKNEEAFKKWFENAKNRPKSSPYSYGISNGQYCRYYDWTTNPQPAFVNPKPWIPNDIPKEKPKTNSKKENKTNNVKKPPFIVRSRSCQPTSSRRPLSSRIY